MSEKRWVQHISGQGEKWEVEKEVSSTWRTKSEMINEYARPQSCFLPKSEYRLCEPPDEWEDVTGECYVVDETDGSFPGCIANGDHYILLTKSGHFYKGMRLRKIDGMHNGPAFIIEHKKG